MIKKRFNLPHLWVWKQIESILFPISNLRISAHFKWCLVNNRFHNCDSFRLCHWLIHACCGYSFSEEGKTYFLFSMVWIYERKSINFYFLIFLIFFVKSKHRRSIFVGCFWFCWLALSLLFNFNGAQSSPPTKTEVFEYPDCVALHPRTNSPPCQSQRDHHHSFLFLTSFSVFLFLFLFFISYWTNSLVIFWWKELLCSRRILKARKEGSWSLQSSIQYEIINWEKEKKRQILLLVKKDPSLTHSKFKRERWENRRRVISPYLSPYFWPFDPFFTIKQKKILLFPKKVSVVKMVR